MVWVWYGTSLCSTGIGRAFRCTTALFTSKYFPVDDGPNLAMDPSYVHSGFCLCCRNSHLALFHIRTLRIRSKFACSTIRRHGTATNLLISECSFYPLSTSADFPPARERDLTTSFALHGISCRFYVTDGCDTSVNGHQRESGHDIPLFRVRRYVHSTVSYSYRIWMDVSSTMIPR